MASELKVDKIYNKSGDGDSGVVLSTNDVVATHIAGSEKLRVHSDGNVGIGHTAPDQLLTVGDTSTQYTRLQFYAATNGASTIHFGDGSSAAAYRGYINYAHDSDTLQFAAGGSERVRIDSAGNLLINTTSQFKSCKLGIVFDGTNFNGLCLQTTRAATGSAYMGFVNSAGDFAGDISQTGTTTVAYTTSSDYRLKENVVTDWDATSRLKQLKPSRFNFKADKDTTVDGFLAHEVSSIVPEAITGEKDAVDKDGKPIMQGIDQSKLVPLLVKTIQELEARIATLEAK